MATTFSLNSYELWRKRRYLFGTLKAIVREENLQRAQEPIIHQKSTNNESHRSHYRKLSIEESAQILVKNQRDLLDPSPREWALPFEKLERERTKWYEAVQMYVALFWFLVFVSVVVTLAVVEPSLTAEDECQFSNTLCVAHVALIPSVCCLSLYTKVARLTTPILAIDTLVLLLTWLVEGETCHKGPIFDVSMVLLASILVTLCTWLYVHRDKKQLFFTDEAKRKRQLTNTHYEIENWLIHSTEKYLVLITDGFVPPPLKCLLQFSEECFLTPAPPSSAYAISFVPPAASSLSICVSSGSSAVLDCSFSSVPLLEKKTPASSLLPPLSPTNPVHLSTSALSYFSSSSTCHRAEIVSITLAYYFPTSICELILLLSRGTLQPWLLQGKTFERSPIDWNSTSLLIASPQNGSPHRWGVQFCDVPAVGVLLDISQHFDYEVKLELINEIYTHALAKSFKLSVMVFHGFKGSISPSAILAQLMLWSKRFPFTKARYDVLLFGLVTLSQPVVCADVRFGMGNGVALANLVRERYLASLPVLPPPPTYDGWAN